MEIKIASINYQNYIYHRIFMRQIEKEKETETTKEELLKLQNWVFFLNFFNI